ncbi:PepSY domain-containing protein [Cupriavidus sp. AU9028]|uniref:PepSY-associated TM helix domain-containing protein n=1 Tax=Cupriavidus sp. AU9028 TaxID=2871157 RepID=UPI001C947D4C|nr:PepSY-associated TM helix domain-containing protein [Cupriavidus sp. AU9028]MBY4897595.1 PepSY domain-containing protein [Cupriavidus sp. AU9028]
MKPTTLRLYQTLHTWVGLMAGWALFIAFFAGALTVFHHELHEWQSHARIHKEAAAPTVSTDPAEVDRFVQKMVAAHPDAAKSAYVVLPTEGEPEMTAYWQDGAGTWHMTTSAKLEAGQTSPRDTDIKQVTGELANFLNVLHYGLGIPDVGIYFMGVVSLLYGVALVSGVLLHLPRLKKDLFAVRPGRNLKRFWMDAHNVLGLFSLPFHLIFAVTGALFCLSLVLMMAFNTMTFNGKLMNEVPTLTAGVPIATAAGRPAELLPAERLLAIAREAGGERFTPNSIHYQQIGDANALADVRGESERALGNWGSVGLHAAAGQPNSGEVISNQTASGRDTNHAVYSAMFALHYGTFGDLGIRLVYLLAGLAGAFVFYSGNLLWIESRRKLRQAEQPRIHRLLAQATVGVCIGCCVGVAAAFSGALLWPDLPSSYVYFPVFFAALAWALLRAPVQAATELLYAAALASLLVPVTNAVVTGDHIARTVANGQWGVAGFDIGAIALAAGYVALARATQRRARKGPQDSVWAAPSAAASNVKAAPIATERPATQATASAHDAA